MLSYLFICRFANREDVKRVYGLSIGCSETFFFSKLMLYKFPHQRKEVIPEILKLLQILKSSKLFSLYRIFFNITPDDMRIEKLTYCLTYKEIGGRKTSMA